MTRSLPLPLALPVLLAVCAASTVRASEPNSCGQLSQEEWRHRHQLEEEVRSRAELLCRHQLLPWPVLSRLPAHVSPSELIRREDLDFLQRHPPPALPTDLDTHGLYGVLASFSRCSVQVSWGSRWVRAYFQETRPGWEDRSWMTPEVLTPESPGKRLASLVRWTRRHPDTVTRTHFLDFHLTPEGWRAAYLFPEKVAQEAAEKEARQLPPIEVRHCPEARAESDVPRFGPGMTPPRWLSGAMPTWSEEALQATPWRSFSTIRCVLTREGEPRDCCVSRSMAFMNEALLRGLSHMRFTPVEQDGRPIDVEFDFVFPKPEFRRPSCEPFEPLKLPAAQLLLPTAPDPRIGPWRPWSLERAWP